MKSGYFPVVLSVTRSNCSAQILAEYQAVSRRLLWCLIGILESVKGLRVVGEKDYLYIDAGLANLESVITTVIKYRTVDSDYVPSPFAQPLGLQTVSKDGYEVTYHLMAESESNEQISWISVQGPSYDADSTSVVTCHLQHGLLANTNPSDLLKKLFSALLEVWDASFGIAGSLDVANKVSVAGDLCAGYWLYYFPFPDLDEVLARDMAISRHFGGVVLEGSPCLLSPLIESDLARARQVRQALDDLGLVWHSTYAIHGWPPDEQEWRYEEFISGAPRGRKYRIRCVDFDGYDAQRNVLLYAKLFRRLRRQRKEWGLRGWDGPVVNEARRQVRAANGTQIEWHIGLEEPAERVRTLLADYTDFKENQLRVLYTPVSQVPAR